MDKSLSLKIAYIAPDFDERATSGGLYVIFEHCNGLISKGHSVRVFNDFGKDPGRLRLDCSVERHRYDTDVIDSWMPDIAVATHWPTFYLLQRLKSPQENSTRLFYLIQSDERYVAKEELLPFYLKTITGKGFGGCPVEKLAVSCYLRNMLLKDFDEESVYIPNGIRIKDVEPLLAPSDRLRITARYDPSSFRGWDTVDIVLRKAASARPDCEIHLFEAKRKKPTAYRSTFHEGYTGDKLLSLFRSSDIFLAANDREGFSYPMLEAMSQGACVCCTDAGGNMDFCFDENTALVSPAGDPDGLYNNLIRLIDDRALRRKISDNGRMKALEFNWDTSVDILEKTFLSLASEKKISKDMPVAGREGAERVLIIWERDPFGDPAEWGVFDRAISKAWRESSGLTVFVKTDRHPMKSARSFLNMLLPKEISESVVPIILYHKKLPRIPEKAGSLLFRAMAHSRIVFDGIRGVHYAEILRYPEDSSKIS